MKPRELRPDPPRIAFRVDEAAKMLGISRAKLYRVVQAGEIATFKVGAATLIKADEINAFMDRNTRKAA